MVSYMNRLATFFGCVGTFFFGSGRTFQPCSQRAA